MLSSHYAAFGRNFATPMPMALKAAAAGVVATALFSVASRRLFWEDDGVGKDEGHLE